MDSGPAVAARPLGEQLGVHVTDSWIFLQLEQSLSGSGDPTRLAGLALAMNIFVVIYLVWKGRLFGVRGGHERFLAELREATLPADLLRSLGRSPEELIPTRIV